LSEFISDLKSVLGISALKRVGRKTLDDDCLGLAGQLAFFSLLSLFPFLMFLVALAGLVINDPETVLSTLTERMQDVLPRDVAGLLVDYIDRTLRSATPSVLFLGILAAFWSGWAASDALIKGTNRAYDLRETRPLWKLAGLSVLMIWGLTLLIATLTLLVLGPEVGSYLLGLTGLPDALLVLWDVLRWVLAFLAVTVAHAVLYYLAPNADLPFKWVTPGGLSATILMFVSSAALRLYAANFGHYDQIGVSYAAGSRPSIVRTRTSSRCSKPPVRWSWA
jgi:membrane protein